VNFPGVQPDRRFLKFLNICIEALEQQKAVTKSFQSFNTVSTVIGHRVLGRKYTGTIDNDDLIDF
jgi:hypothetical protein